MNAKEIVKLQNLLADAEKNQRESIAKQIREAREKAGHTQVGFAFKLGVSRTQYVNLESGRHNFTLYNFSLSCALLDLSANKVLGL